MPRHLQGAGPNVASLAYANGLVRELGYDILAQGIGGYRYEPNDIMKIDGFEPDKIIVALGTNWYDDSSYDYELNVSEFYKKLPQKNALFHVFFKSIVKKIGKTSFPCYIIN